MATDKQEEPPHGRFSSATLTGGFGINRSRTSYDAAGLQTVRPASTVVSSVPAGQLGAPSLSYLGVT